MFGLRRGHPGELSISSLPSMPSDAFELARIWISPEEARSYVSTSAQKGWAPELLGSLLVEGARTAAAGFAAIGNCTEAEAFASIMRGMNEECARLAEEGIGDDQA